MIQLTDLRAASAGTHVSISERLMIATITPKAIARYLPKRGREYIHDTTKNKKYNSAMRWPISAQDGLAGCMPM